jgi:hypothetical protein
VTANGGELTPLTFSESVIVDNYRAAVGGALAAADSVADKVVTARRRFPSFRLRLLWEWRS